VNTSKLIEIVRSLKSVPNARNRHFSFILLRNRILSVGWNDGHKTHPKAKELGYRFDNIHSELAVILNFTYSLELLRRCSLVNIRVNRLGQLRMAMPCKQCLPWILSLNIGDIWYTDHTGQIVKY
jgi:deoxycytidylate deaminase